ANAMDVGARVLVLAGVVEDAADLDRHRGAVACPLTHVRLRVSGDEAARRLHARHADDTAAREWHLRRLSELDAILDAARLPGKTVETTGRPPRAVAEEVLAGWSLPEPR